MDMDAIFEYLSTILSYKLSSETLIIASLKRSFHVGILFNAFLTTVHFFSAHLTTTDTQKVASTPAIFVSHLQHKSLLKERSLVEMINLKRQVDSDRARG